MENIPGLYLLFVLLGCMLATIAVWSRKSLGVRMLAIVALAGMILLNYSALVNLLGRPQPIDSLGSSSIDKDAIVLAASMAEGESIYLWLRLPNEYQPRYYRMDWNYEDAVALKKAMDRSTREESTLMMNHDYETSLEIGKEPLFYTMPHERLPLKPPAEIYEYQNPNNPT
ncbi:MAG: hypothetical protein GKR95_03980 [Gammaproteobacteria bacterium]|nr:hypothetical protein [Gammaproteobacteria bacterium]